MAEALEQKVQAAEEVLDTRPAEALQQLREVVFTDINDAETLKVKDKALQLMVDALVKSKDAASLRQLLNDLRPMFSSIPKAKTAKIVRMVIDSIAKVPNSTQVQVSESMWHA